MQCKERLTKTPCSTLISAEAVLVEAALLRLTPLLLLGRSAATVPTGTLRRLHLLRLHLLVVHTRTAEALLLLGKRLSARAGSCPRIRLCFAILQLLPVPLT
jgi:hypothetical protein